MKHIFYHGRQAGKSYLQKLFWLDVFYSQFFNNLLLLSLGYLTIQRPYQGWIDESYL